MMKTIDTVKTGREIIDVLHKNEIPIGEISYIFEKVLRTIGLRTMTPTAKEAMGDDPAPYGKPLVTVRKDFL